MEIPSFLQFRIEYDFQSQFLSHFKCLTHESHHESHLFTFNTHHNSRASHVEGVSVNSYNNNNEVSHAIACAFNHWSIHSHLNNYIDIHRTAQNIAYDESPLTPSSLGFFCL